MKRRVLLVFSSLLISCALKPVFNSNSREPSAEKRKISHIGEPIRSSYAYGPNLRIKPLFENADDSKTTGEKMPTILPVFDPAEIQACLIDTCGPAADNWAASDVVQRPGFIYLKPSQLAEDIWRKRFEQRLTVILQQKAELKIKSIERARQLIHENAMIQKDHPIRAILTFTRFNEDFAKYYQIVKNFTIGNTLLILDDATFEIVFKNYTDHEKTAAKTVLNNFYLPMIYSITALNKYENKLVQILRIKYPQVALFDAQKNEADFLLKESDRIAKIIGKEFKQFFIDAQAQILIEKAKKGEDLNQVESDSLTSVIQIIDAFGKIFDEGQVFAALMEIPYDFETQIERLKNGKLDEVLANARSIGSMAKDVDGSTSITCRLRLSQSLELNASDLRIRKIKEIIQAVKQSAKSVVANMVDAGNLSAVAQKIDQVEFSFPEPNALRIQRVENAFVQEEQDIKRSQSILDTDHQKTVQYFIYGLLADMHKTIDEEKKDFANNKMMQACQNLPVETISDYAITSLGKINVSWFSANYPEIGVSVLAHEVGHVVSAILRQDADRGVFHQRFIDSVSCVGNRNPYVMTPVDFKARTETAWSEEDWADYFSSLVIEDLKLKHNPFFSQKNKGCALLADAGESYLIKNFDPAIGDTHSSGALRLLFIGNDRKMLAPSCQKFLNPLEKVNRKIHCR